MKRIPFLLLLFCLFSCQTLPVIHPSPFADEKSFPCPNPFLKSQYRLVHAIEFRMAGETRAAVIGVTLADPLTRAVSCSIITPEGMVLFEAESTPDNLKTTRAFPPFDAQNVAKNMLADIKLIFLEPKGKLESRGYLPDGSTVCRYHEKDGSWVDVVETEPKRLQIKRYTSSGELKRKVLFDRKGNIDQRIELHANEAFNYSLLMSLIEAKPVIAK